MSCCTECETKQEMQKNTTKNDANEKYSKVPISMGKLGRQSKERKNIKKNIEERYENKRNIGNMKRRRRNGKKVKKIQ